MQYTFINDLFTTEEEMRDYLSHNFPYNLPLIKERLDAKLKDDPDYEVFVPFYYRKYDRYLKDDTSIKVINPPYLFISNKGRIISNNAGKGFKEIPTQVHPYGYINAFIGHGKKVHTISVHRAVACNFIPVKEKHLGKGLHPKDLEVNHMNGVKLDFSISNLEWSTTEENKTHAKDNKLYPSAETHKDTKPVKGEVIRGKHIGYSFIVLGAKELEAYGFDQGAVSHAIKGDLKSHYNCKWAFATKEDRTALPREIPNDILNDIKGVSPFVLFKYIGTCLKTGVKIEAVGYEGLKELGFNPNAVRNNIAGLTKSSKGYSWIKEDINY